MRWTQPGLTRDELRMLAQIEELDWDAIPVSEQLRRVVEWNARNTKEPVVTKTGASNAGRK
jgi:hypothetical protein